MAASPSSTTRTVTFNFSVSKIQIGDVSNIDTPYLNEQFFLIDLARSRIELSTEANDPVMEDRVIKQMGEGPGELQGCPGQDQDRRNCRSLLCARSAFQLPKKKKEMAIAARRRAQRRRIPEATSSRVPPTDCTRLQRETKLDQLPGVTEPKDSDELGPAMGSLRVGFAEGYARKDAYDQAFKIANAKGSEIDQARCRHRHRFRRPARQEEGLEKPPRRRSRPRRSKWPRTRTRCLGRLPGTGSS